MHSSWGESPASGPPEPNQSPDDVVVAVGTRPEAIKVAGVVRLLGPAARLVHTGQHYDAAMWSDVLADLPGVRVRHRLHVGGRSRGEQIGAATQQLSRYLIDHPARAVVVQGDTNSTLAGALAAHSAGIPLVHIEAGLRSHDRAMPEETNRVLVDAVADLCCAPVESNVEQLRREGVPADRICRTGNTLADSLFDLLPTGAEQDAALRRYGLTDGEYVLATLHRAGNVDRRATLAALAAGLTALAERADVLLALHPHTAQRLQEWGLRPQLAAVRVVEPMRPSMFLALEARAGLLVSDSGGVQEEACLLRRPLLVLRDSTERPELLDGWSRLLVDGDPAAAMLTCWQDAADWRAVLADRPLPYPDTQASARIVAELNRRWPPSASSTPLSGAPAGAVSGVLGAPAPA
jgi:UDP-N-acetylglucosamine 2-epimerase (non-hydrolysing)